MAHVARNPLGAGGVWVYAASGAIGDATGIASLHLPGLHLTRPPLAAVSILRRRLLAFFVLLLDVLEDTAVSKRSGVAQNSALSNVS